MSDEEWKSWICQKCNENNIRKTTYSNEYGAQTIISCIDCGHHFMNDTVGIVLTREELELLIEYLNYEDYVDMTPLMDASRDDDEEMVKLLLKIGVDINHENIFDCTALDYAKGEKRYAEGKRNSSIIKLLIEAGAKE